MTDKCLTSVQQTRRRKLDELFDDQPYLSATMRATRLHERLADELPPLQIPIMSPASDDDVIGRLDEARRARLLAMEPVAGGAVTAPAMQTLLLPTGLDSPPPLTQASSSLATQVSTSLAPLLAEGQVRLDLVVDVSVSPPRVRAVARPMEEATDVMTVPEAARFLRVGASTLRAWANQGRLPSVRMGRHLRFRRAALLEWLAAQEKRG